jgi:hypothetical protein
MISTYISKKGAYKRLITTLNLAPFIPFLSPFIGGIGMPKGLMILT